tara:strand:- start:2908 stop:3111 length:204 start_codon:yes stop_codon:yes gene_type:complete
MSEETVVEETIKEEVSGQPIGVQAQVVLSYLEELYGAITMLSSNLSNQIKSLSDVIDNANKENETND